MGVHSVRAWDKHLGPLLVMYTCTSSQYACCCTAHSRQSALACGPAIYACPVGKAGTSLLVCRVTQNMNWLAETLPATVHG